MAYYIHAAKFFLKNTTETNGYLEITDDGKFGSYYPESAKPAGKIVEYGDKWVAPGLFDTHIHGLLGHDVTDGDWDAINEMSEGLLKAGVTSWLPTTVTASFDQLNNVCKAIGDHQGQETGAKIRGIHFEGPYFTEEHKGAQDPKYLRDPDIDEFHKWQESAHGLLNKISIAPERKGAAEFTRQAVEEGVVVSIGHSSATYEQAKRCIEAGASMFTHTYNGMNEFGHRDPGMVGAAYTMDDTTCEIICDGHHNAPAAVRVLIDQKTPDNVALVTDCMRAGLMPDGDYMLGELEVYVKDDMARLKVGDNLAGSILLLKDALKNVVDWNIATPEEAVRMGSLVPAKSMHMENKVGLIVPGADADFLILNPDMTLSETYLDGKSRYQA
ncbi:N-acetylglucosamine-6-phosphate deacetylase [Ligilactobacillus aviarius]|uniref:N-acetylglucosamine-6-phosphate deacetylase n=1 Tax=Ligilactobacillus aviarius TaxID=1606 RepID=UPI0024B8800A|nr:N-acetylglucosamine-6-phosphate deacetylase [Ligilactobacillus aviarius]